MPEYEIKTIQQEVYVSEKRGNKDIFRYEWKHSEGGWWIIREHYNVDNDFPQRSEIWLPDAVVDHITVYNAKDKLS